LSQIQAGQRLEHDDTAIAPSQTPRCREAGGAREHKPTMQADSLAWTEHLDVEASERSVKLDHRPAARTVADDPYTDAGRSDPDGPQQSIDGVPVAKSTE
jgi:hypothetical protein